MPTGPEPVVARRRLCRELRAARLRAAYTQHQAADDLGWSRSKLIRVETGRVGVTGTDLKALLDLYGVTDPEILDRLLRMGLAARRSPWTGFADLLSGEYLAYLACESVASRLRLYDPLLIPGPLRTEQYARVVVDTFAKPGTPQHIRDRHLQACLARQAILDRADPAHLRVVLDEAALRRRVGTSPTDTATMRAQITRLQHLADRPRISIQILPLRHGIHFGLTRPFALLDLPDPDPADPDLPDEPNAALYLGNGRGDTTHPSPADVHRYEGLVHDLAAASSPPHDAHRVLDAILADHATDRRAPASQETD